MTLRKPGLVRADEFGAESTCPRFALKRHAR